MHMKLTMAQWAFYLMTSSAIRWVMYDIHMRAMRETQEAVERECKRRESDPAFAQAVAEQEAIADL